jgi:hypothetical protein
MRSAAPLESEMVPPPAHDPDNAANGPAPWAWACDESSKTEIANAAPRHAGARDGIDGDGMGAPSLPGRTAGTTPPIAKARTSAERLGFDISEIDDGL